MRWIQFLCPKPACHVCLQRALALQPEQMEGFGTSSTEASLLPFCGTPRGQPGRGVDVGSDAHIPVAVRNSRRIPWFAGQVPGRGLQATRETGE